ncbi:tyrosine-type recombinase/integrase [Rhodococcus aetherivorans]|uniref:tyrosine-type recombinase/integrase n=1 Tax=Rhodococcus aetherivorans TaxID=191292 RepID=UPI0031CF4DEE
MATVSSYETAKGKRYRVRYRTPEGRQTDKRGFPTKKAAEAFANSVEVDKLQGSYVSPSAGRVTIGELGPDWLARQKAHMKPSGHRSYDSAWRIHVEPRWATTQIVKITYSDVQAWVAELAAQRGASVVQTAHAVLARILEDAVRDRRLPSNPARGVKLPRKVRKPNRYLTQPQVWQLADEAGRYKALVLLLSYVGLRWGEVAGLRVRDIDFLRRRAILHQNAVQVGTKTVVGTLKGHKHRIVPLPKFVVDELAMQCRGKSPDDLLWPSQSGGHLAPPSAKDSWLSGAVERCQRAAERARAAEGEHPTTPEFPRVTAHDLRHTAASLAISAGANVKAVQRMLGHASAAMTLDVYADLFDDDLADVARRMEEGVDRMRTKAAGGPS